MAYVLIADGVGVDTEVGDISLRQVFVTTEGGTANPAIRRSVLEDFSEDGHAVVASDELAIDEKFAVVVLLAIDGMMPNVATWFVASHDDFLVLIATGGGFEALLVHTHGHIGAFVGTVLG